MPSNLRTGTTLHDLVRASVTLPSQRQDPTAYDEQLRHIESGFAQLWDADRAYALHSGAASGHHALLLADITPGEPILVARDAGMASHAALILSGASPVWVMPRIDTRTGLGLGLDADDVAAALDQRRDIQSAHIVSPSHAGICTDLVEVRAVTAARDVALFVDETAGAHLRWHPQLSIDAMSVGADAALTSLHRFGPAAPQAALLLVRDGACEPARLAQAVRLTEGPGVDMQFLMSLRAARTRLSDDAPALVGRAVDLARMTRSMLNRVPGVRVISASQLALPVGRIDPCHLVIDVRGRGVSGRTAARILRIEHGITVSDIDAHQIHVVIDAVFDIAAVRRLVMGMASLGAWSGLPTRGAFYPLATMPTPGEQALTPRGAWFADTVAVPLRNAVGRISAELVSAFPPGVPASAPGEVLTADVVAWLFEAIACDVRLHGADDPTLATIRVVATT
jgi:arginine/lysine/ornithine decarboxylase